MTPVDRLVIALAQINSTVGDVEGNLARLRKARAEAAAFGADLVMFSELFISGYPPEDLVLKTAFQEACRHACEEIAQDTADQGPAVLVGLPWMQDGDCFNAYALLDQGRIEAVRFKVDLPNYGVFDEKRVFKPGPMPGPIAFRGVRIGIPICEDIWGPEPVECLSETGGEILLVPNGSPYWRGKTGERLAVAKARVAESHLPLIYLNQFGGQDDLVFDGASFALNADASLAFQLPAFEELVAKTIWTRDGKTWICAGELQAEREEGDFADYQACVLGIDSALCAAIAVDALGAECVHCTMLPYRFTSAESLADAKACAEALHVRYDVLPIAPAVEGVEAALAALFAETQRDVTEENIQSRVRGTLLMALSNKFGSMLITTGNKSEMSVGYATIYGDMNGGFNPIKDLYKTEVFRLSHLRNKWKPKGALGPDGVVIPLNIIEKPPSAELRENQKDQDSLPPYEILDAILEGLVEQDLSVSDVAAAGYNLDTVRRIERLLYLAEYKRRQSPPGVKVTKKNFGRDRRYPIVNRFRDGS
jgi:NAD+ synthase